jgi:anti-sigma factor RsiW
MRCKDIERLIIASSDEDLSSEELKAIEQHVGLCAHCARFQEELGKIRKGIKAMATPELSADLAENTRLRCYAEMKKQREAALEKRSSRSLSRPIPVYVWITLFVLTLLTMVIIFPVIREIRLDQTLTFKAAAVLTLIIQNAVMLFFAPILIRKYRSKREHFNGMVNANAS